MKKRIALMLCLLMIVSVFSGCSLVLGGLAILWPHLNQNNGTPADPWADYACITIAEALELCGEPGNVTAQRYYIRGTVVSIDNPTYGAMTITDKTGTISVYNSTDVNEIPYADMAEKPYKDYEVLLYCILQNHNGTKEVKQAYIVDFVKNEPEADASQYGYYTLDEARKAPKGTKMQVEGIVARITYANGKIPNGVMLVDHTDSIYIYDSDLAGRVSVGNKIVVRAEKDYWILENEQKNAEKFGYKGCNQLTNAIFVSSDNGNQDFDKSWIQTSTVKEIIDTPVTEDISTKIFKVTAQIKKMDGNGFVNYYINDLDGKTGSYTYTQCNGSDFAWLDAFDGKICTVYLTALNAKSTASDCYWRLLPVAVLDEGFDVNSVNFAENAVKLYGVPQFLKEYTGNPALELLTSVDNELLGYSGAALRYTSSNPAVISIDGNVMNCLDAGTVTITVTAEVGGTTYSEDVTITVKIGQADAQYGTVADAIGAAIGEKVTVKGVVGPSIVNQSGFYLIDETGVIAVLTDEATLATLEIGYEVILEGNRQYRIKSGGTYGNTCISDATVLVNNYGSHEYSTASFDGVLTLAQFAALDVKSDYTTSVYTVTAKVEFVETNYYTNVKLVDGSTSINLYCKNADQYKWLRDYAGQTITMEIAPCNWSSKSTYPGCVLAVIHEDGAKTVNTLNFN